MRRNRCVTLRACAITALTLAIGIAAAPAQDVAQEAMQGPRVSAVLVDWDALIPELRALDSPDASQSTAGEGSKGPLPAAADIISRVNLAAGEQFANIAASPVPVLLPFDTPAFLRDREGAPTRGQRRRAIISPASIQCLSSTPDQAVMTLSWSRAPRRCASWAFPFPIRSPSISGAPHSSMSSMSRPA
jgi:hypothetical protein